MSKQNFSKLDIKLTTILVVIYVPLSLWGGANRWAGATDYLPIFMLLFGAAYVIVESFRLCSPPIGAILGGLVPLVMFGPSLLLYPYDIEAFFIAVPLGCLFGLIVSSLCWYVRRSKVETQKENDMASKAEGTTNLSINKKFVFDVKTKDNIKENYFKISKVQTMLNNKERWMNDEKVRQSLLAEIEQLGEVLIHSIKQDFYASMSKKKNKKRMQVSMINSSLEKIGLAGLIGAEQLLNNEIIDEDFIQDIIKLAEEDKHSGSAAFALLGIEIAKKEGKYIPIILDVFRSSIFSIVLIDYLGKIKWDERVVDHLIDLLSKDFVIITYIGLRSKKINGTSYYASRALLEIGNERGIETMVFSLLQKLSERVNPDPKGYIQFFLTEAGKPVVKYLIQGLSFDDPQARVIAANCLGDIGDPTAFEVLAKNTTNKDAKTANAVVIALGKLGDPRAIPVLLPLLASKNLFHWDVIQSLNNLKDVWQAPLFIDALKHEDPRVVLFAINALKIIKDKSAIEPLTALLESDNKKIRKEAFKALKTLK